MTNVILPKDIGVTYDMIGGLGGAKELLRQCITYPLRFPHLYSEGIAKEAVKGVLLFGPPGGLGVQEGAAALTAGSFDSFSGGVVAFTKAAVPKRLLCCFSGVKSTQRGGGESRCVSVASKNKTARYGINTSHLLLTVADRYHRCLSIDGKTIPVVTELTQLQVKSKLYR